MLEETILLGILKRPSKLTGIIRHSLVLPYMVRDDYAGFGSN